MADDGYQFEDEKLPLSADPDHSVSDDFDDFQSRPIAKKSSKRGLILVLLFLCIAGAAGAFFIYPMLSGNDEQPIPTLSPIKPMAINNGLPASVTPVTPSISAIPPVPPVVAPVPPTPGLTPVVPGAASITPIDNKNAVTATALPAPATPSVTPAITPALVEPKAPIAAVTPPITSAPAAVDANAVAKTDTVTPKPEPKKEAAIVPAPAEQLTPISPAADDEAPAKKIKAVKNDVEKRTADTMNAVNDILDGALPSSGNKTIDDTIAKATGKKVGKKPQMPPPPEVVTSRAEQVIKVKRSYSASSPQAMNAAGDRVLDNDQYEAAIQIYNKQLQSNPSDIDALSGKAIALQKANRDEEAMDVYQRLMSLNPKDVEALTNYLGLLQKQKPEEAMDRLNNLSDQYPDNAAVSAQIATVFASQMDTPNALRYFMKAKALDESNATYPFNVAVLYDRMGNASKAAQYYQLTVSLVENNPDNTGTVPMDSIRDRLRHLNN